MTDFVTRKKIMSNPNNMFGEFAKMAEGAMSAFGGVKDEMDSFMRQHLERLLSEMELVSREEFEVVKAMATKARSEQEMLLKKVAELEAKLAAKPAAKPAAKKAAPKKAAPRKPAAPRKKAPAPKAPGAAKTAPKPE